VNTRARCTFQPTLPRGERPGCSWLAGCCAKRFNPRSRAGSDPGPSRWPDAGRIVSTHAPARGATVARNLAPLDFVLFQPTLPRGERRDAAGPRRGRTKVSTHAPARGATLDDAFAGSKALGFQPTLPRGERLRRARGQTAGAWFQPTLPRGERPIAAESTTGPFTFQPTLPRGERPEPTGPRTPTGSSFNPRSRAGSDSPVPVRWNSMMRFQPTLPRGERNRRLPVVEVQGRPFQPTLPRGERPRVLANAADSVAFQPTLPRGERLHSLATSDYGRGFNPRSRAGSDPMHRISRTGAGQEHPLREPRREPRPPGHRTAVALF